MQTNLDYSHLYKLLIIGDSGTGKSSLLLRYTDGTYSPSYVSTIGVDFKIHMVEQNNKKIKLQIWDTAGQERFKTIVSSYYRGTHCVIVAFDLTDMETFTNINNWLSDIKQHTTRTNILIVIIGTKSDLKNRVVTNDMINNFCNLNGFKYFEISSVLGTNINELFNHIVDQLINCNIEPNKNNDKTKNLLLNNKPSTQKSSCC